MNIEDTRVVKMERELASWAGRIDDLWARASRADDEGRLAARARIHQGHAKHYVVLATLDALKSEGVEQWDRFRVELERVRADFEASFQELED